MWRVDSLEKTLVLGGIGGRRKRGRPRMRWLDGIIDLMDVFEWTLGDGDGQGGLACCDSWGRKESDTTKRLNWTETYTDSLPTCIYQLALITTASSSTPTFFLLFKKSLLNFFQFCFFFTFWFFGQEACRILAPWPGTELVPPALKGEVLTTGLPGRSPGRNF